MPFFDRLFQPIASPLIDGVFTVDTLPTPTVDMLDRYARVTDLFGEKRDLVLCSQVSGTFFWQPVRATYAKNLPLATDVTLTPLKSPSVVIATGTVAASRNIVLSNVYAYPGASFEVGFTGTISLGGITIRNLTGTGPALGSLVAGGSKRFFYTDGSWQNF